MADTINYPIRVAIFTKLLKVFEDKKAGKFLSFPVFSIQSYTPEELSMLSTSGTTSSVDEMRKRDLLLSEFSCLVNKTSRGIEFGNDENKYLWDVYNDFVENAEIASFNLSSSDEEKLKMAIDYLFNGNIYGPYSDAYNKYKEYKDAYYVAQEKVNNKELDYQLNPSDESKAEVEAAKQELMKTEREWEDRGNKTQTEKYLQMMSQLSDTDCSSYLKKAIEEFHLDTVLVTVPNEASYAPSYIFPAKVSEKDWLKMELSRSDVEKLLKEAPEELISGMEESLALSPDFKKVTFECRTAGIQRPWFKSEALLSPYWRFHNSSGHDMISYGTDDLSYGQFPSYVASVVMLRNMEVEEEATVVDNTGAARRRRRIVRPSLNQININAGRRVGSTRTGVYVAPSVSNRVVRPNSSNIVRPNSSNIVRPNSSNIARPTQTTVTRPTTSTISRPSSGRTPSRPGSSGYGTPSRHVSSESTVSTGRVDHPIGKAQYMDPDDGNQSNAQQAGTVQTESVENVSESKPDEVQIMAFICMKLGTCPNPASSANWPDGNKMVSLTINQLEGGQINVLVNGKVVNGTTFPYGQTIVLAARPNSGRILKSLVVNGVPVELKGLEHTIQLGEDVSVIPVWDYGKQIKLGNIQVSPDGKTLEKVTSPNADFDMNQYSDFQGVVNIGTNAFKGCDTLQKIKIAYGIQTIGPHAFTGCSSLSVVEIPSSVIHIDDASFPFKSSSDLTFVVDSSNPRYASYNGMLVEKNRIKEAVICRCSHCGFEVISPDNEYVRENSCPVCGNRFNSSQNEVIFIPDGCIPFKTSKLDAQNALIKYYKKKYFTKKDFISAAENSMEIRQVYLPVWSYDVESATDYNLEIRHEKVEQVKNPDGTVTNNKTIEKENKTGNIYNEYKELFTHATSVFSAQPTIKAGAKKQLLENEVWTLDGNVAKPVVDMKASLRKIFSDLDYKEQNSVRDTNHANGANSTIDASSWYSLRRYNLLLYPAWVGTLSFEEKEYKAVIDGYTGKVDSSTKVAKDKKRMFKTFGIIAGILIVLAIIAYFLFLR